MVVKLADTVAGFAAKFGFAIIAICLSGCGGAQMGSENGLAAQVAMDTQLATKTNRSLRPNKNKKHASAWLSNKSGLTHFGRQLPSSNLERYRGTDLRRRSSTRKFVYLSQRQVDSVIRRNRSTLGTCYEHALRLGSVSQDDALRIKFELTVRRNGTVKAVDVSGKTFGDVKFKRCLARRVQNWRFPKSRGTSQLSFPFMFTSG